MTLEILLAEREISLTLSRLARAMDDRDWDVWREILLPDSAGEYGTGPVEGREALITYMKSYLDSCGPTQHLLGNLIIQIEGETATSTSYVADMHVGVGTKKDLTFRSLGDYHDEWRKVGDSWRLVHRLKYNHALIGSMEVFSPDN